MGIGIRLSSSDGYDGCGVVDADAGSDCMLDDADGVMADDEDVDDEEDGLEVVNELNSLAIRPREGSGAGAGVLGVSEAVSATAPVTGLGVADSDETLATEDGCGDKTRVDDGDEDDDEASSGVKEFRSALIAAEEARRRAACKRCV
jgi:hypothetical protein